MRVRVFASLGACLLIPYVLAGCEGDRWRLDSGNPVDVPVDRGVEAATDGGRDGTVAPDASDANDAADGGETIDVPIDVRDATFDGTADVPADSPVDSPVDVRDVVIDAGPSGRCTPTIDGTIGADWSASAIVASNSTATNWGVGLNELRSIRLCYDATSLYFGITGTVEATNAIVTYIDRDYAPPGGSATGVSLFSVLTDNTGALDNRISASLSLGAGAGLFGAEAAWGTDGMLTLASTGLDDNVGLRLIGPSTGTLPDGGPVPDRRADFAWIAGAQSSCVVTGAPAYEVAIAWASLFEGPRPASGQIALFLRINSADGSMSSNQTLPEDAPATPRTVNRVLVMPFAP